MTTQAGWYPDPQAAHLNRWWDGGRWTSQTTTRVAQPAEQGLPTYPVANPWWVEAPPRPKPRGPKIFAIVGITLLVGYLGLVAVFSLAGRNHTSGVDAPPTCGLRVTSQMPPTTAAFVRVLFAYNTQAEDLSNTLQKEGTTVTVNDVEAKAAYEVAFADGLAAIPFTGKSAEDATRLAAQSRQLAADLLEQIAGPPNSDLVARIRQNDYDPAPREALRVDLGLPAKGTCTFRSMY
jgi:Protein of unknown function (DUF2510)